MDFAALVAQCSPQVDLAVAHAIVKQESRHKPFAIGVTGGVKQPKSYTEAVQKAKQLLAAGRRLDLGLAQINSQNLAWLGLTVEQVFEPCTNLRAMQRVYLACYAKAGNVGLGTRMQRAFSCYNAGNMQTGFRNGYVNNVTRHFNTFLSNSNRSRMPQVQAVQVNALKQTNADVSMPPVTTEQVQQQEQGQVQKKEQQHNGNVFSMQQHSVFF